MVHEMWETCSYIIFKVVCPILTHLTSCAEQAKSNRQDHIKKEPNQRLGLNFAINPNSYQLLSRTSLMRPPLKAVLNR